MPKKIPLVSALALLALCATSCTALRLLHQSKLKSPQVSFIAYRLVDADEGRAKVEFMLAAYNPNKIGLKNVTLGYGLFHEGKRFLHGDDIAVELKPMDTTRIAVPAVVVYREVFRAAGPAAEHLLLNRHSIPVRIDAVIAGKPTVYDADESGSLFQFTLHLSRTEDVPIPESVYQNAEKAVSKALHKMF